MVSIDTIFLIHASITVVSLAGRRISLEQRSKMRRDTKDGPLFPRTTTSAVATLHGSAEGEEPSFTTGEIVPVSAEVSFVLA